MTFPVVASVSSSGFASNSGGNIAVTLPSGVTPGDLLICILALDGGTVTSVAFGTLSNGWAKVTESIASVAGGVFWKYADGTDALDIPCTSSSSEVGAWVVHRITGAHGTTPPEIATPSTSSGTTNPDPPSLTLSGWGTEDTLWFAAASIDNGIYTVSSWPSNYAGNHRTTQNGATTGATTHIATRELAASSEDPGTFTTNGSEQTIAWTIAVRPAAGGGSATVTPSIIASTATTGSHTVARTALAAVTASRIESTASIGAHVVSAAGVAAVTATRIASTATFGTATVARTAVAAVSPTRIASTATFGSHAVAAAGMGAVSASRIASTVSFGAATVTRTAVHSVQPGRIDSSVAFGVPSVTSSTPQIVVGRIASTAAVYAPVFVRTGPVVAASEYRRFASPFATLRQAGSAITQTVTLASAIDLE